MKISGSVLVAALQVLHILYSTDCTTNTTGEKDAINGHSSKIYMISLLPEVTGNSKEKMSHYLAGKMAVDMINNRTDLLSGYKLELIRVESGCELISTTSFNLIESLRLQTNLQAPLGIVGLTCTESDLLVSTLNSRGLALPSVHNAGVKEIQSSLSFGMLPSILEFVHASLSFNLRNNWSRIAVMFDESSLFYRKTVASVRQKLSPEAARNILVTSVYNNFIPLDTIRQEQIRIIYLLVGPRFLSTILCLAFHRKLYYPAYQWVIVARSLIDLQPVEFVFDKQSYRCNASDINVAANNSVFMHYKVIPFDETSATDLDLTTIDFFERYQTILAPYNITRSEASYLATVYFDSIWVYALALNASIQNYSMLGLTLSDVSYEQPNSVEILRQHILALNFKGISGSVQFSEFGFVYRPIIIYSLIGGALVAREYWDDTALRPLVANDSINYPEDSFANFGTVVSVPEWLVIVFFLLGTVSLILLIICHALTCIYRKSPSIRAKDPKIMQFAFVGCYLCSFSVMILSIAESRYVSEIITIKCTLHHITIGLLLIGITLIFGALCAKTWRLYRIFVHYLNPGAMISEKVLISFVIAITAVQTVAVLAWIISDPFFRNNIPFPEEEKLRIVCVSRNYYIWFPCLVGYDGVLVLATMILALLCHKINQNDFKTNPIVILVYLVSVDLVLGFAVFIIIPRDLNITLEFIVLSSILFLVIYPSILLLFVRPLYPIMKGKMEERKKILIDDITTTRHGFTNPLYLPAHGT